MMASCTLKSWAKKHQKLYAFLWGMPLYRKVMYGLHNHLPHHVQCVGTHWFDVAARMIDMFLCLWIYGCSYSEYNLYGFNKLKHRERSKYICDCCRKRYYMKLNSVADMDTFRNKNQAYQEFKKYYNRRACVFQISQGFDAFSGIVHAYKTAIIKPDSTSGGYGITKVSSENEPDIRACFDAICSAEFKGKFIIEEYIEQAVELKELHPSSLNTARIITIVDRDGVPHILGTLFRIGKDGMIVDNGASGGLLCKLSANGTIERCVDKKNNQSYDCHPTTNHHLIGFTIPRWEEAKTLALQLALHVPCVRYCGWDLALTNEGWIMVEGNEAAELAGIQIFSGGCKPALARYI